VAGKTCSQAACPLYIKDHSYGEYVFDWAWANAYEQHGVAYYPKAVVAVPFTPRARHAPAGVRHATAAKLLVQALVALCKGKSCRRCTCCSVPTTTSPRARKPA
jgi:predicted N-acyltransferase